MEKGTHSVCQLDTLEAWRLALAEVPRTPALTVALVQRGPDLFGCFSAYYQRLRSRPRAERRRLQRRLGLGLAGIALLLALNGGSTSAGPAATIVVDGTTCTLADAITAANTDTATGGCITGATGPDTIDLQTDVSLIAVDNSTYGATGLPVVNSAITIEGNGHTISRASGSPNFRILAVGAAGNLTLNSATLSGGYFWKSGPTGADGGAIYNKGALTVQHSTLSGNSAAYYGTGGAIRNVSGGTLIVANSTLSGNSAVHGGAIHSSGGTLTVLNSTLANNSVYSVGGGIVNAGTLTFQASVVSGNRGRLWGGGIYNTGNATIENSVLSGNSSGVGGGIHNRPGSVMTVSNSTISGNTSQSGGGSNGGGISNGGTLTVSNSTLSGNSTGGGGGGIFCRNGGGANATLVLQNSTISGNSAVGHGGGLYIECVVATVLDNTFSGNSAACGGGVFNGGGTTLNHNLIAGNSGSPGNEVENGWLAGFYGPQYNLFGHSGEDTAAAISGFTPGPNNIIATSDGTNPTALASILNTTLANNGGPTQTHALPNNSPAIDGGAPVPCGVATDQRGQTRDDWRCDIGAVEVKLADTDTVIKAVGGAGTFTFGPTLAKVEVADTGGCLTGLTVRRVDSNHPNAGDVTLQTGHYWAITPEGCLSGFSAGLTLPTDFTPDESDKLCRYTGSVWNCAASSFDAGAKRITRLGVSEFSDWVAQDNSPLAVTLAGFDAQAIFDHILLSWETVSEANNAGFNLYRSASPAAPDALLAFVPSQAPGSTQGASYTFDDTQVTPGQTWYYWLEDVDLNGATSLHGPVSATLQAPTAVTLDALEAEAAAPGSVTTWGALAAALIAAAGVLGVRRRSRAH